MSVIKDLFAKDSLHTSAAAHTGINKKCQHISVFYRYYSTSVVSMLLFFSSCIVSYDLLSPWVPRSVCVCVTHFHHGVVWLYSLLNKTNLCLRGFSCLNIDLRGSFWKTAEFPRWCFSSLVFHCKCIVCEPAWPCIKGRIQVKYVAFEYKLKSFSLFLFICCRCKHW